MDAVFDVEVFPKTKVAFALNVFVVDMNDKLFVLERYPVVFANITELAKYPDLIAALLAWAKAAWEYNELELIQVFWVVLTPDKKMVLALAVFNAPCKNTVLALAVAKPPEVKLAWAKAAWEYNELDEIQVFCVVSTPCV